jgi:CheY-like chemotaxis protein
MATSPRVLVLDDDPSHLEIYGLMVQKAGFESIPVLVRFTGPDPIPELNVDLILLDYRLNSVKTAPEIAQEVKAKFPDAPIVLLSDLWSLPADVAPFVTQFVRKGDPAKLLDALRSYFPGTPGE